MRTYTIYADDRTWTAIEEEEAWSYYEDALNLYDNVQLWYGDELIAETY